jgi:hypothetical protein
MRIRFMLVFCALLFSAQAIAQDSSRIQVFGGYSYTGYYYYPAYTGPWTRSTFNGWEASGAFRLMPHLGVEGDFGGSYGPCNVGCAFAYKDRIRTYMGGPRVTASVGKASFYGHVLFGELTYKVRDKASPGVPALSSSDTTFAMAVGGGADFWFSHRIGARLVQVDYLRNNNSEPGYFAHPGQHANIRISTGAVFRF